MTAEQKSNHASVLPGDVWQIAAWQLELELKEPR